MCGALCDLLVASVATSGQKPPEIIRKCLRTFLGRVHQKGAAPFPKAGRGTVHLRYDAWNVCLGSLWWAQPRVPKRGGAWKAGLEGPPPGVAMDPRPCHRACFLFDDPTDEESDIRSRLCSFVLQSCVCARARACVRVCVCVCVCVPEHNHKQIFHVLTPSFSTDHASTPAVHMKAH